MKTIKTSEAFAKGNNDIYWVGTNFKEHFYATSFTEAKAKGLQTKTLGRYMLDKEIFAEFDPQPVTLGDVRAFLSQADKSGWYIFYVKDSEGTLWAVGALWDSGRGWGVAAGSVTYPGRWDDGDQVVSREFLTPSASAQTLEPSDTLTLEQAIKLVKEAGYQVAKII